MKKIIKQKAGKRRYVYQTVPDRTTETINKVGSTMRRDSYFLMPREVYHKNINTNIKPKKGGMDILRLEMWARNWTQRIFAKKLGITHRALLKLLRPRWRIGRVTRKLYEILGVNGPQDIWVAKEEWHEVRVTRWYRKRTVYTLKEFTPDRCFKYSSDLITTLAKAKMEREKSYDR